MPIDVVKEKELGKKMIELQSREEELNISSEESIEGRLLLIEEEKVEGPN